jgi:RNA-directed DNA polymerase
MSLETPDMIRSLQRKLYCKAKAEPAFRFYILYDKVCREDILLHAYALTRANAGAPGVDGITFGQIEASGVATWLAGLREDLVSKTYRPDPVRRVMIPKPGGGERPLGIPTIRDRVAQAAAKIVLEPVFEADFEDSAYGYRPRRSAIDAVKETHRLLCRGYTDVVDADLSKYFDTIPHADLLRSVGRRIVDRHVLWLIKLWLRAPVEERDGDGKRRMSGGKDTTRGTPQGGVVSRALGCLHEPIPEALAPDGTRRGISRACRLLCRRLCHPQPRPRGRGIDLDEGGDDEARADAQRDENLGEECPA